MLLILGCLTFTTLWILFSKFLFPRQLTAIELWIQFAVTAVVITLTLVVGDYQSSSDIEIIHGYVVSKSRTQDYFQTSYECNCVCVSRDKQGSCTSESCQTCYTDHYTVDWELQTSLGGHQIDYIDQEYKSAWNTPDPNAYTAAYELQPFSRSHSYTNYFLLYKESLFNNNPNLAKYSAALSSSTYPEVYGYAVDLVFKGAVPGIDTRAYNDLIRDYLREAGVKKQVNIILYFTSVDDQAFRYALEAKWNGGRKNDVIVLIGADANTKPKWVDVISLGKNSGNEMLQVSLREDLINADLLNPKATTDLIFKNIEQYYHRKHMSEFKYMEAARQTPIEIIMWVIGLTLVLNIGLTILNVRCLNLR